MALISCPECGKQVSDTAPTCLGCGAPVAQLVARKAPTTSPSRSPETASPKGTTTSHTILRSVAITFFVVVAGIALGLWFVNESLKSETERIQKAEIDRLLKLPEMPIQLSYRRAITGPGLVVSFRNTSNRALAVAVTLRNPSLNQQKIIRIDVSPSQAREVGYLEGWAFASGDTIRITHNDYKQSEVRVP